MSSEQARFTEERGPFHLGGRLPEEGASRVMPPLLTKGRGAHCPLWPLGCVKRGKEKRGLPSLALLKALRLVVLVMRQCASAHGGLRLCPHTRRKKTVSAAEQR